MIKYDNNTVNKIYKGDDIVNKIDDYISGIPVTSVTWESIQELAQTHTVVEVGTNKLNLQPAISGITLFRLNMNSYGQSYYCDLYREHLNQDNYFGIQSDRNGTLYKKIDGYRTIRSAADSSSCTWAYWIDQNTIEVNVVEAVNDTVILGFYDTRFSTPFISFPQTTTGTTSESKTVFQYFANGGTPLPYDAEIEYLQSDGTQYINTGLYLNTSNFEIGYEQVGVGTEKHWGYAHQGVASGAWVSVMHDIACFGQITNYVTISPYLTSGNNILKYTQSGITVNGTTLSKNLSLSGRDNLNTFAVPIFGWYDFDSRGIQYSQNYQLKSFYIKNNGELVLDMIPVRVGQVGYMYDRVSGELFGNDGTGSFILGADKN